MAEKRTCDYQGCGAEGALPVIVSVSIADFVAPDTVTGHEERADACDTHRSATRQELQELAWDILSSQLPLHVELDRATKERDEAIAAVDASAPRLRNLEGKTAAQITDEDRAVVDEHNALVKREHEARAKREEIAERGTRVADEAREKGLAKLRKKPAKRG